MKKPPRFADLELRVLRTIRKYAMLKRGEHIIVAASGGADSTALLLCLHDFAPHMNLKLTVAHLNHGLRGAESDADEEFVRRSSAELGLPFLSESADLRALAAAEKRNLEEAAREARYEFLRRAAASAGADKIATGHNLNDQAETILLRLLRGSGPGGLSGIHPVIGGRLIRPLLECSRRRILDFLAGRNAAYREDATNLDMHYQRNRVRHELTPYLEKHFNPRLIATLSREAGIARAAFRFLEDHARLEFEKLCMTLPDGIALPAAGIAQLHPALRPEVVRQALRKMLGSLRGIGTIHIEEILRLCEPGRSGRRIDLPCGVRAQRDLETLELRSDSCARRAEFRYELAWPGRCAVPEAGIEFLASFRERLIPTGQTEKLTCAFLDPDTLPATLTIRSRLPGDRYGGPGHRKVKKMLLAARVPLPVRASLPLVAAGEVIIWAPGFIPAKTFRAKPGSSRSVLLEARRMTRD